MNHLLIVDDAATVRMYHRGILEAAGYAIDEAINGLEALEKAVLRDYDLYLIDVNMPKLDGYALVRRLRSDATLRQAPAIMISTEAEGSDQRRAYEAGANLYLIKPAQPSVLLAHVRMLLGEAG